jgi:PEGA domain
MIHHLIAFLIVIGQPAGAAVLSVEDFFGVFTFSDISAEGHLSGFIQFNSDHTWFRVVHVDNNHDQVPEDVRIERGNYRVKMNEEKRPVLSMAISDGGEYCPSQFIFADGKISSFVSMNRAFHRRKSGMPYFDHSRNKMPLAKGIYVDSKPRGARVFIDGKYVKGLTPLTIEKPTAKVEHIIRLEYRNRPARQKTVRLGVGENLNIHFNLLQADTELWVRSRPDTRLIVDGRYRGETTIKLDNLSVGEHELSFQLPSLGLNHTEIVHLERGEITKISRDFLGRVRIRVGKPVDIFFNEKLIGKAPGDEIELPIGRKVFKLVDQKGEVMHLSVKVELDTLVNVEKPFKDLDAPM